jgi:hypothetical protein
MGARRRGLAVAATVASIVTAGVVGVGVARSPTAPTSPRASATKPGPSPPETAETDRADLSRVDVLPVRAPFCGRISEDAVTAAVGQGARASDYASGAKTTLEPGLTDVAHEFGCVFTKGTDVARIWLFAAPVTADRAERLVDDADQTKGCEPVGELTFGSPGSVLLCQTKTELALRAVGRLGDSWVHCELSSAPTAAESEVTDRGQAWCAAAASALG